jgi:hypothetical protein
VVVVELCNCSMAQAQSDSDYQSLGCRYIMDKSMSDMPPEERARFACVNHHKKVDVGNASHLDVCPYFVASPFAHTCVVHGRVGSSCQKIFLRLLCTKPRGCIVFGGGTASGTATLTCMQTLHRALSTCRVLLTESPDHLHCEFFMLCSCWLRPSSTTHWPSTSG